MKVLFVIQDMRDANFIRHEVEQLTPDLHLDISQNIQDAIGQLEKGSGYDAVILDSACMDGHPLTAWNGLLADTPNVPIVMLINPGEEGLLLQGVKAGAVDYVTRTGNYFQRLAATLNSAFARRDLIRGTGVLAAGETRFRTWAETMPAFKNLFELVAPEERYRVKTFVERICRGARDSIQFKLVGLDGAPHRLELKVIPIRRDATGATRVLLRNIDIEAAPDHAPQVEGVLEENLHRVEGLSQQVADELQRERQVWEKGRTDLEQRQQKAEKESARLQEALQASEAQIGKLAEEFRGEREQWNLQRIAFKQQLKIVEGSLATLEQAVLTENARREELEAQYAANILQSEVARQELDQQRHQAEEENSRLQAALGAAEAKIGAQTQQFRAAKEEWELTRLTLEQQRNALEARIVRIEETRAGLVIERRESLAQAEKSRLELENRAAALTDELRQMMERFDHALEKHQSERTQWESIRNELEQRKVSLEEELRLTELSRRSLLEEQEAYRLQWQRSRIELGQLRSDVQSMHALAREADDKYQLFLNKLRELSGASEQRHHSEPDFDSAGRDEVR